MTRLDKLVEQTGNTDLKNSKDDWKKLYGALVGARAGIVNKTIDSKDWVRIASESIKKEFDLRDLSFAPSNPREMLLYYNSTVRKSGDACGIRGPGASIAGICHIRMAPDHACPTGSAEKIQGAGGKLI